MFKKANKGLIIAAFIILAIIVVPIVTVPNTVVKTIGVLYSFITVDMAWLFLLLGVFFISGAVFVVATKFGDIRLGGKDAKPHYSTFMWVSMNLCSALAAGALIFGVCEWMYYITQTPLGAEPGSVLAYEYASAYPLFHWGFSAWAFYLVPGLAIGYLYWNKKIGDVRVSALCKSVIGGDKKSHKAIRNILDVIIVFCYFMMIMTTVGIGTPVMGELVSDLTGMPNSFALKIAVIIVFGLFFTLSTSKTIAKGMGVISDFNIKLAIGFLGFVLVVGDTAFILNNLTMSIGTMFHEFIRMSFNTDAVAHTGFAQNWTIFYWAWYVALAFACGLWIARTSYGRTFREITIANCVYAPMACWVSFGILGNYGIGQELFHGVNLSGVINTVGNNGVTVMVLKTMPLAKLCIVTFLVLIFFNLATTITANGTSLSMYTSKGLKADEEPSAWFKTFWSVLLLVIPIGILILEHNVEGLNILKTIQSMITISAIPMLLVIIYLLWAFVKEIRKDIKSGEILDAVDDNRKSRWS